MSTAGGLWRALERGQGIGCEVVQLFVKNNMQWEASALKAGEVERFLAARAAASIEMVFGHAGYLINLAAPPSPNLDRSIRSLTLELERAEALQLPFLVLHPGAHLGGGESAGLSQVCRSLDQVFRDTAGFRTRVALENTAGQGTCLGASLQHLARIYHGVADPQRLAVCLDTAHLFASGHDIRTSNGWNRIVEELDRLVGLDQWVALHLNDSKTPLGSRVDRHAGIGQGCLGSESFRHIVNDPRLTDIPGCLETPKSEDLHEDVENLAVLRGLAGTGQRLPGLARKPSSVKTARAKKPKRPAARR